MLLQSVLFVYADLGSLLLALGLAVPRNPISADNWLYLREPSHVTQAPGSQLGELHVVQRRKEPMALG